MNFKVKIRQLEQQLKQKTQTIQKKEQAIQSLKAEVNGLKRKETLQDAVLEAVEECNQILSGDEKGKQLLWTTNFPHNLDPGTAEKLKEAVKKNPNAGDLRKILERS